MMEHADGSDISVMTVILKSLGVASASDKMAELFCRNRFGSRRGFRARIRSGPMSGWMNDNEGQQRLHAAVQQVSPAGEQLSVATRIEAA